MNPTQRLRHIIIRAKGLPLYRELLQGLNPEAVSAENVRALPLITRDDLIDHFQHDITGGFLKDDVVQMHLTPAPKITRMPEFLTRNDLAWQAEAIAAQFARCGITADDRCLVVFSYHMLAGGWLFHEGLIRLGATVLPLGPNDAATVAEIVRSYGFNVLISNPSFARKIGEAGATVEKLVAAGEPFSAVPGYRKEVQSILRCTAFDSYGLSETGVVASETLEHRGLVPIQEAAVLEVLDPETHQPVGDGEKGELVITSLTREGMPILRFRTGDLTMRGSTEGKLQLPRGVFGRTDSMVKVKGVKLYPKELAFLLAGTAGVDHRHYQLVIDHQEGGSDTVILRVQGEPGTDIRELSLRIQRATGIRMNAIVVEEQCAGDLVVDQRFHQDAL